MKPITGLFLVASIICFCFLPFVDTTLVEGSISGLSYTAAIFGYRPFFSILPFVATFFAIGFNSLKNRYWGIAVVLFIVLGLYYYGTVTAAAFPLAHDPEALDNPDVIQGLPVKGLAFGHITATILMAVALVSAIISMLPFRFNRLIEQSIDNKLEEGRKHLHRIREQKQKQK